MLTSIFPPSSSSLIEGNLEASTQDSCTCYVRTSVCPNPTPLALSKKKKKQKSIYQLSTQEPKRTGVDLMDISSPTISSPGAAFTSINPTISTPRPTIPTISSAQYPDQTEQLFKGLLEVSDSEDEPSDNTHNPALVKHIKSLSTALTSSLAIRLLILPLLRISYQWHITALTGNFVSTSLNPKKPLLFKNS